jgi:hypothetical protein
MSAVSKSEIACLLKKTSGSLCLISHQPCETQDTPPWPFSQILFLPDPLRALYPQKLYASRGRIPPACTLWRLWRSIALSGHTHHGQLSIPPLRWCLASPFVRFAMGRYRQNGSVLYVHPESHYGGLRLRLGAWPEVTLITLYHANAADECKEVSTSVPPHAFN